MDLLRAIMRILTPRQRRRYFMLQAYFLFSALVQVAGVASIAPFIALVSNPALIHEHAATRHLAEFLDLSSDAGFLMAFAVGLMALIVFSNAVVAIGQWLIVSFSLQLGVEMQKDIYHGYLHRNYVELARTNSADLVAVVNTYTPRFVYMVMQPLLNLISQGIIVILVVSVLLWYDTLLALAAGLLIGGGYIGVFAAVRRRLVAEGKTSWLAHAASSRILNESLGGIKEIRLLGTEALYEGRQQQIAKQSMRADTIIGLLSDLPRFVLEAIAFCALLGLGIFLLSKANRPQDIVGVLSLYAMAAYRLLPSAQSVFKSASQIKANASIVSSLEGELVAGRNAKASRVAERPTVPMPVGNIRFDDVWFAYPGASAPAIRGASVEIKSNTVSVLVGTSGAGKSTFADLLLGLLPPSKGVISVNGQSITENIRGWQANLGYVPQTIFLLDDTIAANICLGAPGECDDAKVRRAAAMANIDQFIETLPGRYDYVVGERGALLSGGQRQRIGIARALYHNADVLVLDEATSALDTVTERDILNTLANLKREKTIIMIAHRLATIQAADQVILISDGRVVASGTYDTLMYESEVFRNVISAGHASDIEPVRAPDIEPVRAGAH